MLHDPAYKNDGWRPPGVSWGRKRKKEISTFGRIPTDRGAYIYVGVCSVGRVKIGMSTNPEQRCVALGLELRHRTAVVPQAAKEVETAALQRLGHDQGDGEWLSKPDIDLAVQAINHAMANLRRRLWVDPDLTEDEARRARIRIAIDEATEKAIAAEPCRPARRISITSHRKAAGVFGRHGGRFG